MDVTLASLISERAQKRAQEQNSRKILVAYAQYVRSNRHLHGISRVDLEEELNLPNGYITLLENGLLFADELPKWIRSNIRDFFSGYTSKEVIYEVIEK